MILEREQCYNAMLSHDARFDGRFFVGVSSTGIYCRPVCSVKTPLLKNCRFYVSAAAAEVAGHRPCLRCRPELAPGQASVDAGPRLAQSAAALLDDDLALDAVASQLHVTDRHLRRVFRAHYGVSPVEYRQTQRLLMAKRLLTDTRLPVTEIALASGFQSVRRFNSLFLGRYRMPPSRLRKDLTNHLPTQTATAMFDLGFRPPLAWTHLLGFLAGRAIPGVEHVVDGVYSRAVKLPNGAAGRVAVTLSTRGNCLRVELDAPLVSATAALLERVKRLFDLAADPVAIAERLGSLANALPGARVPGCWDPFELLVRAILGQQISVKAARTLAGRLARSFGATLELADPMLNRTFPDVAALAVLTVDDFRAIGLTRSRAATLLAAAKAVSTGQLNLRTGAPIHETMRALRQLPGIGEWTAQYVAMRAVAWPDAFPHGDLVLRRAMGNLTPARALAEAEQWRPWRAYAAIHLWHSTSITDL